MESIIKKAIEGGWSPTGRDIEYWQQQIKLDYNKEWTFRQYEECYGIKEIRKHVLDSLFWKSLSVSCRWGQKLVAEDGNTCLHCEVHISYQPSKENQERNRCNHVHYPEACSHCSSKSITWQGHAIDFYQTNLNQGWEKAVAYLEEVTK